MDQPTAAQDDGLFRTDAPLPESASTDMNEILKAALAMGGSDVHISGNSPPLTRVMGGLVAIPDFPVLGPEACQKLIYSCLYDDQKAKFEAELELDCALHVDGLARFRVNVMRQRNSVEAVLRAIPTAIPSPEELGITPVCMRFAELPRGLVLVTGPTGSGKTTTLACLIEHINKSFNQHIITLEDPIEYIYERKKSLIRQREVGADTHSFQKALRQCLRQDPDVIMIGELRDLESISLAITAAETGHLCFATLHTKDAAQTTDRLVDVFPAHQQQQVRVQLAASLKGVVCQTLLPRANGYGQVAAREVMVVTPGIANLIREGKTHQIPSMIETGRNAGMIRLDKSLEELVLRGLVHRHDALAAANDPKTFMSGAAPRSFGVAEPTLS